MKYNEIKILQSGNQPNKNNVGYYWDNDDLMLFSAWLLGFGIGHSIHRRTLFSFIQSHFSNKAEENLQKTIETSLYWSWSTSGVYVLNKSGYDRIIQKYGKNGNKVDSKITFEFTRLFGEKTFTVIVDYNGYLTSKCNNETMTGIKICEVVEKSGGKFRVLSNSKQTKFWNWVIQDANYSWRIINYDSLIRNQQIEEIKLLVDEQLNVSKVEEEYFEGEKSQRFTNYYERKAELKLQAILIHGSKCMGCDFDFEKVYGKKFIEVHHLKPISQLGGNTKVDPKTDMAVVCPNCHRMIHHYKSNYVLTLEELKEIIQSRLTTLKRKESRKNSSPQAQK